MKTKQNIPPDKLIPSTAENFDQCAAKFQESPIEFKRQFTSRPKPQLTRTERNDKLEKL